MFFVALPDPTTGACGGGTAAVYRLWNQRADSNHRYTTSTATKTQMLAQGYVAEGYGPDAVAMCAPPGSATLLVTGGAAAPYGALLSDGASTPAANYHGFTLATDSLNVGAHSGSGEVITFGLDRPVAVQPTTWVTSLADQLVTVPFPGLLEVPITIWVVAGPFATTQQTALTYWQTAQTVFTGERLGIRMSAVEIVNATANPNAGAWSAFGCGTNNANVAALQAAIGARPGRINVYLVGLVDGSTSRGTVCTIGGGFVGHCRRRRCRAPRPRARPQPGARARRRSRRGLRSYQRHALGKQRAGVPERRTGVSGAPALEFGAQCGIRPAARIADARLRSRYSDAHLPCDCQALVGRRPFWTELMSNLLRCLAWTLLAIAALPAAAQPRYGLSPEAYAVFSRWMTTSCLGDQEAQWRAELQRHAAELAPAFRRALADGPTEEAVRAVRGAADVRYRALAVFPIAEYRIEGDSPAVARIARPARQGFVDDQVQRYVTGYKSNAIAALGILDRPEDRTLLRRIASRTGDPLAAAAAEATKAVR